MKKSFDVLGVYDEALAIVGTALIGARPAPAMIVVALEEDGDKRKKGDIFASLSNRLRSPDLALSRAAGTFLSASFLDAAKPVLKVQVTPASLQANTIENVLATTSSDKIIFLCDSRETYLATCGELGMSKRDFFRMSEVKHLLQTGKRVSDSVIGRARKLAMQLESGDTPVPGAETLSFGDYQRLQSEIGQQMPHLLNALRDSAKFVLGDTDGPNDHETLNYPADYRLPFKTCLFDYDYTGRAADGTMHKVPAILLAHTVGEGQFVGQVFCRFKNAQTGKTNDHYDCLFAGPSWRVDDRGRVKDWMPSVSFPTIEKAIDPKLLETLSLGPLMRILPTLAALNNPATKMTEVEPPRLLQRKSFKEKKTPFFKYYEIDVEALQRPLMPQTRGNAIEGRSGVALHKVRGHERNYKSGESMWIDWHYRGDPAHGIVHRSLTDMSKEAGPAKLDKS